MPIGDHLRDVMDLYGSPKCPHTNAVLIAAGLNKEVGYEGTPFAGDVLQEAGNLDLGLRSAKK